MARRSSLRKNVAAIPSAQLDEARSVVLYTPERETRIRPPTKPSVRGYLYAARRNTIRTTRFELRTQGGELEFGGLSIPGIRIHKVFRGVRNAHIFKSFITLHHRTFLVFGFNRGNYPENSRITNLKPTTKWRGDVAVLCLGTFKPLLKAPRYSQDVIDEVAAIFVSRVTEHTDRGRPVPLLLD